MNISVYIPSYNQRDYLKEAIESVLRQTLKPMEILIVDDCSTDQSRELIESFATDHPIIRYIFNDSNEGIARVRQKAINALNGEYITYVDGDDLYLPNKLETEARLMQSGNFDISFSNNYYVDPDDPDDIQYIWATSKKEFPLPGNMFIETITRKFPRRSLFRMELVNRNLLRSVSGYDERLKIYEDYDLRIRLSKRARINYSLEPTTKIRISKNGLSKSPQSIRYQSLAYIFSKYENEKDFLNDTERTLVRGFAKGFLAQVCGHENGVGGVFEPLKRVVRHLIRKF